VRERFFCSLLVLCKLLSSFPLQRKRKRRERERRKEESGERGERSRARRERSATSSLTFFVFFSFSSRPFFSSPLPGGLLPPHSFFAVCDNDTLPPFLNATHARQRKQRRRQHKHQRELRAGVGRSPFSVVVVDRRRHHRRLREQRRPPPAARVVAGRCRRRDAQELGSSRARGQVRLTAYARERGGRERESKQAREEVLMR